MNMLVMYRSTRECLRVVYKQTLDTYRHTLCLTGSVSECRTAGMPTDWIDNHVTLPSVG